MQGHSCKEPAFSRRPASTTISTVASSCMLMTCSRMLFQLAESTLAGEPVLLVGPSSAKSLLVECWNDLVSDDSQLVVAHLTPETEAADLIGQIVPISAHESINLWFSLLKATVERIGLFIKGLRDLLMMISKLRTKWDELKNERRAATTKTPELTFVTYLVQDQEGKQQVKDIISELKKKASLADDALVRSMCDEVDSFLARSCNKLSNDDTLFVFKDGIVTRAAKVPAKRLL